MEDIPPCDRCGSPSVADVDDGHLCASCFHEAGSCCGTFGEKEEEEGDGPANGHGGGSQTSEA